MHKQLTLVCSVLLVAAGLTEAHAAKPRPKPVCNLVVDAPGDGNISSPSSVSSDALDILSVDVATTTKTLGAVLRFKSTKMDVFASQNTYGVDMSIAGSRGYRFQLFRAATPATGESHAGGTGFTKDGTILGYPDITITDTAITLTVPRSIVPHLKKRGSFIDNLSAQTKDNWTGSGDSAANVHASYRDLLPSCLTLP